MGFQNVHKAYLSVVQEDLSKKLTKVVNKKSDSVVVHIDFTKNKPKPNRGT